MQPAPHVSARSTSSSRLPSKVDWVVLGDSPGALLTGACLAKLGYSVLEVPVFPGATLYTHTDGRWIDPESPWSLGLSDPTVDLGMPPGPHYLRHALEFALSEDEDVASESASKAATSVVDGLLASQLPVFDWATPHWRWRMPTQPRSTRELADFWNTLSLRPWLRPKDPKNQRKKRLRTWANTTVGYQAPSLVPDTPGVQSWPVEPLAAAMRYSNLIGHFGRDPRPADPLHWDPTRWAPPLWNAHLASLARLKGGQQQLRELLQRAGARRGVQRLAQHHLTGLVVQNGALAGIQVSGFREAVSVQGACLGVSVEHVLDALPAQYREKMCAGAPRPSAWIFSIALGVSANGKPEGSGDAGFWSDPQIPLEWEWRSESDRRPSTHWVLHVRAWLPFTEESVQVEYLSRMALRMRRWAREMFPFLEQHERWMFPDPSQSQEVSEVFGFISESLIPENLRVYGTASDAGERRGFFARSSITAPSEKPWPLQYMPWKENALGFHCGIERLFVASHESYPRMGLSGQYTAALSSILEFSKWSGLEQDPRLHRLWTRWV